MATTTITGTINGVNNTALANKWITFRLVQLGTDSAATATVAQSVDSVQTDANGDFSIDVWNNGDSGKTSVLEITIDGSKAENVIIPTGAASIELWDLIENFQADGSTPEQVPVVSDLFLRKSLNLSDIGSSAVSRTNLNVPSNAEAALIANNLSELTPTASTARTNLGVTIGADVQAHSSVLDATTASFTIADESKLDGIEAFADVTDATNIASSGGYVAGGTDVALTDGGTGASDAPTARTNLGVPSSAEALLVANNLSEVDPATARANLGVPSSQEGLSAANNLSELTPTASTARTNIDVPSTSEALLAANNLSEVDPATARASLNVLSVSEGLSAANNLSELTATSATARTNIGVEIGSDVQAHSAILDATDASFTTAKDTAILTNAADIASNDTDIGILTGSVVQNQTDIANAESAILNNTIAINDKIPNGSTTGTADATTFLRGDNTWATPSGGGSVSGGTSYPYTTDFQLGVMQTRDLSTITVTSGYNDNSNLTSIYIGGLVGSIELDSFTSCNNLTRVTIPEGITTIGNDAFRGCLKLNGVNSSDSIIIPDSVVAIGNLAFSDCTSTGLTSVVIGSGVAQVGSAAFKNCTSLTSVTIPNNVTSLGQEAFNFCTSLITADLPTGLTEIKQGLFNECNSLQGTTIPAGVTIVESQAFSNCTSLASISCLATTAPTLTGISNFLNVLSTTIDVPVGATGYGATYGGLTVNYVL